MNAKGVALEEQDRGGGRLASPVAQPMSPGDAPTAPFVLSLIAGVLFLLAASMPLVFMSSFGRMRGMMEGFDGGEMLDTGFIALRIVGLAFAGVVIYAAIMLNSRPAQHVIWGTVILVFSILSMFTSWAGFGIGLILGVIGGVLAIAWKPTFTMPPHAAAAAGRFCTQCGRATSVDARFCSYCGHDLPA